MQFLTIAKREIKLGFRNPWAYTFMALISFFSLALLLILSQGYFDGYTHTSATMINLNFYLLPLMTLLLGAMSVAGEKEEGGWQLLSSYPLSSSSFLWGKYVGLAIVLLTIVSFGFGLSALAGWAVGSLFPLDVMLFFFLFSSLIVLLFLAIAVWAGTVSKNRWQALALGVGIWFIYIIAWPTLLISVLGLFPYPWIQPSLQFLTYLNPAEFIRIFMVTYMGGGSIFGPEYYRWVNWIKQPSGILMFVTICLAWLGGMLGSSILLWERGRARV